MVENNQKPKVQFHERLTNVPSEFVVTSKNQDFIKLGGLLYLVDKMGIFRCTFETMKNTPEEVITECKGILIPSESYMDEKGIPEEFRKMVPETVMTARGVANLKNLRVDMHPHMYTMSESRALSRCLRFLTGCSATSYEEMGAQTALDDAIEAQLNPRSIKVSTAADMLSAMPKNNGSRADMVGALEKAKQKKENVRTIINYLDEKGIAVVGNLSDEQVSELLAKMV